MKDRQNIIKCIEHQSIAGSFATLNSANKCMIFVGGAYFLEKLLLGWKTCWEKEAEIQEILQQPTEYLIFFNRENVFLIIHLRPLK